MSDAILPRLFGVFHPDGELIAARRWKILLEHVSITEAIKGITEADMATMVTSKGQVTIPKPLREHLGIEAGSAVEFELAPDGRVTLVKLDAARPISRFEGLRGRAGAGLSTEEIMALTRGDG
jgi:antitoxin PrlF